MSLPDTFGQNTSSRTYDQRTMSYAEPAPIVSAVITVYNKAAYLPATIQSLRRQMPNEHQVEFLFVDDASTDGSVPMIEEAMQGVPHLRIITNPDNQGPSIRLNQGAKAATAPFLYFLDGDDIAAKGAMAGMLNLLQQEDADFIYAKLAPRGGGLEVEADGCAPFTLSEAPLAYIMKGGFVRMALMCRRELFLAAGGADERVFVQDESLPLRLAAKARRFIDWQATVIAKPEGVGAKNAAGKHISSNKTQLHHDAFFAYANMLEAIQKTHPDVAPKLYANAVSAYWKYGKRQPGPDLLHPGFWRYLESKCLNPEPKANVLAWMATELKNLPNIRRPKATNA